MPFSRRRLLGFATFLPWLPACDVGASTLARKLKGLPMQPISAEEIELLKNPLVRPAWFSQNNLPQGRPLEIHQRILGDKRGLLRGADLKDVRFVSCIFDRFQGIDNNLENVQFEECRFLGGEFSGPRWTNVSLKHCEAEGPFKIGCADGDLVFEDCKLRGMTVEEGGYGNWADHFGLASGGDGRVRFLRCHLDNLVSYGETETSLIDCTVGDFRGSITSHHGTLLIENCNCLSEKNKHDFGGSKGFSRITIHNSKLGLLDLMGTTADILEVVESSLSLEIASKWLGDVRISNSMFHHKGLYLPQSRINRLLIENCTFSHGSQGLLLSGKVNIQPRPGEESIYWKRVRELILRNQTFSKAEMAYTQAGNVIVENSTLTDCNLSNCRFGTWRFVNAKLSGSLDLSGTTIRHIENQGLTQNANINGKLEASSDAPEPDVQNIGRPPGDKQSK